MIKVQPFGNWDKSVGFFKSLPSYVMSSSLYGQKKHMDKIVATVKAHIKNQDLDWEPLSESWVETKGTDLIYLDTTKLYLSIKSFRSGYTYYAGIKRGIYYDDGLEVAAVANIMENGAPDKNLPARPVWGPSIEEHGGVQGIRDSVINAIVTRMTLEGLGTIAIQGLKSKLR